MNNIKNYGPIAGVGHFISLILGSRDLYKEALPPPVLSSFFPSKLRLLICRLSLSAFSFFSLFITSTYSQAFSLSIGFPHLLSSLSFYDPSHHLEELFLPLPPFSLIPSQPWLGLRLVCVSRLCRCSFAPYRFLLSSGNRQKPVGRFIKQDWRELGKALILEQSGQKLDEQTEEA